MTHEKSRTVPRDRAAVARAVRRRLADHRIAADLRTRGWDVQAPTDDLERHVRRTVATRARVTTEGRV